MIRLAIVYSFNFVLWILGFLLVWNIPQFRLPVSPPSRKKARMNSRISVIIPARNEESRLPDLLASLKQQSVKLREIIVVDDGSTDGTARIAKRQGARLIRLKTHPTGWLGKSWACWTGARAVRGEQLIFLDADTRLAPDALRVMTAALECNGGLVSFVPWQVFKKPYERLSAYFIAVTTMALNQFSILQNRTRAGGAHGQCLVCGRKDYFRTGGHRAVRGELVEDLALARVFQKKSLKVRCYGGRETISVRMYGHGMRDLADGWTKNISHAALRIPRLTLLLIVAWSWGHFSSLSIIIESVAGGYSGVWSAVLFYAAFILQWTWILKRTGDFGILSSLLYPVELLFFLGIFIRSLFRTYILKRVRWKGREIRL